MPTADLMRSRINIDLRVICFFLSFFFCLWARHADVGRSTYHLAANLPASSNVAYSEQLSLAHGSGVPDSTAKKLLNFEAIPSQQTNRSTPS